MHEGITSMMRPLGKPPPSAMSSVSAPLGTVSLLHRQVHHRISDASVTGVWPSHATMVSTTHEAPHHQQAAARQLHAWRTRVPCVEQQTHTLMEVLPSFMMLPLPKR